jgi:osmotically-inducible protein OsmY
MIANNRFVPAWLALILTAAALLSGCAGVVVGGAATTAAVANDRRTTGTVIEDQTIELKAAKAIRDNKDIDSQTHVNVTSYNQIVLVTGEANSEELRQRVIDLVRSVEKVRHVHDEIRIAPPSSFMSRSNDTMLTTKVKTKLFATKNIDATRVKVVTEAGTVYLMGLLSQDEGQLAAEAASQVGGVAKVVKLFEYVAPAS